MSRLRYFANRLLAIGALTGLAQACALVLGLEDKELGEDLADASSQDAQPPDGTLPDGAAADAAVAPVFAGQQDRPIDVAVDSTHVYWINEGGQLRRKSKGAQAAVETMAEGLATPRWMASDSRFVFWVAANDPRSDAGRVTLVGRVAKDKSVAVQSLVDDSSQAYRQITVFDGYPFAGDASVDAATVPDNNVFTVFTYGNGNDDEVRAYGRVNGGLQYSLGRNPDGISAIVADDVNLYFAVRQGKALRRRAKGNTGAPPDAVTAFSEVVVDLAVDPTHVYALLVNGAVVRVPKAGAAGPELVAQGKPGGQRLTLDDTNVYFTSSVEGDGDGRVYAAPKRPGALTVLAGGQRDPRGIAVESDPVTRARTVTVAVRGEGAVKRVLVP
jgi:hypothetical protein